MKLTFNEIKETAIECLNSWHKYIILDPNAISILKQLSESKVIALISNFDHPPHIYSILSKLRLKDYFQSIIISGEVGIKKPNPHIFSISLEQTKLKPSEIFYVGDTTEDMLAALNAGIIPILIQRDQSIDNDLYNDFYVNQLKSDKQKQDLINKVKIISNLSDLIKLI